VVSGLRRPLHCLERRKPLSQALELLVDRRIGNVGLAPSDLEPLVGAELCLRAYADLDRELERLALAGQLAELQLGLAHRRDPGAIERVHVPAPERAVNGLVDDGLAPEPADHHRRGHLPLAKAGDPHLSAQLHGRLLHSTLDLLGRHLGVDADARLGQLRDVRLDPGHPGPDDSLTNMLSRIGGRIVTSPLAFLIAGVVDVVAYTLGSLRRRLASKRSDTWQWQQKS
jgi:hypothetical protein